jgi:hypothetical protein
MADTNDKNPKASSETTKAPANKDAALNDLQAEFDKAAEQGFFGNEVDSTPNQNYTLQGVASGAPTPETDADARATAQAHAAEIDKKRR